jgi:soluble lytic murein transglycosylase-like protein
VYRSPLSGLVLAGVLLLRPTPSTAKIYYQVDEQGVAHFTNAPTTPEFQPLEQGPFAIAARPAPAGRGIDQFIEHFAGEHDLDAALIRAVIQAESNFNPRAISRKGAQGLMQLMPGTIQRFSVGNAFDPYENIGAGARYLRLLLDQFEGDLTLALAAYNAGENAVLRYRGVPPYPETQDYVRKVRTTYERTRPRVASRNGVESSSRRPTAAPSEPMPPRPSLYKVEQASGAVVYSNLPPIVRSP